MTNNNPFLLEFTLKQHTPLIHFQPDQQEATLRATEVKPKLDRFITEIFLDLPLSFDQKKKDLFKKTIEHHFSGNRDVPVNSSYKIKFSGEPKKFYLMHSQNIKEDVKRIARQKIKNDLDFLEYSPYFADNDKISKGKWEEVKLAIDYRTLKGEIFSIFPEVKDLLTIAIPYFFCLNNFGCRQSKGFGSFTVTEIKDKEWGIDEDSMKILLDSQWSFAYKLDGSFNTSSSKIKKINELYKSLKASADESKIRDYFEDQKITWERPTLTDLAREKQNSPLVDLSSNPENKYVRALLGLAELHDYEQKFKIKIKIKDNEKDEEKKITRFSSPVFFKAFQDKIFLCANPVPEIMLNRTFQFFRSDAEKEILLLNTPDEFDIIDFLNNALNIE